MSEVYPAVVRRLKQSEDHCAAAQCLLLSITADGNKRNVGRTGLQVFRDLVMFYFLWSACYFVADADLCVCAGEREGAKIQTDPFRGCVCVRERD